MIFPDLEACRSFVGLKEGQPEEILEHPQLRAEFAARLISLAKQNTGSSTLIKRALILTQGPQIDRSEMTDKGSINQRAVLDSRRALVELLYSGTADPRILEA